MKTLFDTSVLIAAMVETHKMHSKALPWLKNAKAKKFECVVASHTLAELYAVLTTLPVVPRIQPGTALRLIHENVEAAAHGISLTASEYRSTIRRLSEKGLAGGIVYDGLIAAAAVKANVKRIVTLNVKHFKKVWPGDQRVLVEP